MPEQGRAVSGFVHLPLPGGCSLLAFDNNMKMRLIILSLLIGSACLAQEIKCTPTPWDSLAIPLDISAYYLTVDSSTKVESVALEFDLYIKGQFIRTLSAGGIGHKASPLKANCAIYLDPKDKEKIQLTFVVDLQDARGLGKLDLLPSEFPMKKGSAWAECSKKIAASGRTPVFTLIAGSSSSVSPTIAEDTPKENPNASVIIAYLKTK
jgi:hypothetical protein